MNDSMTIVPMKEEKKNEKETKNNEKFDDDRSEEERERINLVAMAMAEIL